MSNIEQRLRDSVKNINSLRRLLDTISRLKQALSAPTREREWQPGETAPKDGSEFLSVGPDAPGKVQPTRWLSPGPYSTENGKNAEGERRYQWPDGFYWAGYDGFVGPVRITDWRPFPELPRIDNLLNEESGQ